MVGLLLKPSIQLATRLTGCCNDALYTGCKLLCLNTRPSSLAATGCYWIMVMNMHNVQCQGNSCGQCEACLLGDSKGRAGWGMLERHAHVPGNCGYSATRRVTFLRYACFAPTWSLQSSRAPRGNITCTVTKPQCANDHKLF